MAFPPRRLTLTLLAAGSMLMAAGCGDDDSAEDTLATIATPTTPPTTTPETAAPTTAPPTTAPPTTAPPTTEESTTTTSTTLAPTTTTAPATTTTVPPTTVPAATKPVPGPTGLGVVEFGAGADDVIAALTALYGAPTEDTGWIAGGAVSGCGGTEGRRVDWGVLSVVLGERPGSAAGAREFVAYAYGSVSEIGGEPTGLQTAEGIGLGSSVVDLQAAYPTAEVFPGEEGLLEPSFAISEEFAGLLTSETPEGTVTVIYGGPCV